MDDVLHSTLVFERRIAAPPAAVFAALADPQARASWGAPSDTAVVIYDRADFRVGGQDQFRCGARSKPNIHGVTTYLDIVAARRIVSSESLSMDGRPLCVSLSTVQLTQHGDATSLKATTQLVSFIGADMVQGHTVGTNASLDNLAAHFA